MALNYLNYGLQNPSYVSNQGGMNWSQPAPSSTPQSSGGIGGILSGGIAGASLGPLGALAGAGLGAAGSALNAIEENKRLEEEKKRYKQGVGRNAVSLLNDNFVKALARSRGGF